MELNQNIGPAVPAFPGLPAGFTGMPGRPGGATHLFTLGRDPSRLQVQAPHGGVLVCATTHAAARTEIRFAAQPPVTLRGRSTPTEVWVALAAVPPQLDEGGALFRPYP